MKQGIRRVLHVIASLNPAHGGPPEMVRQLARNYQALGVSLQVVTMDAPDAPWMGSLDFPALGLGPTSKYGYSGQLQAWLHTHIGEYDLAVVNGVWQFHGVAVWRAARRAHVPYAVFAHGALDVFFKQRYPMKHLKKLAYWPLQHRVLRDAQTVLFTSQAEQDASVVSFPSRYRSAVVPYGTNPPSGDSAMQRAAFFEQVPQVAGKCFLLYLGRIHRKKGCDLLIRAFGAVARQCPEMQLVMAGPDQTGWRTELEAEAGRLGVADRVVWPGLLSGDAKYGAFRAAEAFVLPSHQENFGIAVAEALACGTPVLISNQVNIWADIVQDGVGLVESDTYDGTLRLLRRWLEMTEQERADMRLQAERTFHERYSLRRTAQVLADLPAYLGKQVQPAGAGDAEPLAGGYSLSA